jgi:hypothetical protein
VNLMITMVLGGLWHGAHLRFLLWGFLHGLGLVVTHAVRDIRAAARSKGPRFKRERPKNPWADRFWNGLRWLAVFHFVSFLWVFFRAENAGRAWEIFRAALDFGRAGEGFPFLVIPALLAGLGMQLVGGRLHDGFVRLQGRLPVWAQSVTVALITILILKLGPDGVLPFIYFQF